MTYSTPSSSQPLADMTQPNGVPDMAQRDRLFGEYSYSETLGPKVASATMVSPPSYLSTAFGSQLHARPGATNKG